MVAACCCLLTVVVCCVLSLFCLLLNARRGCRIGCVLIDACCWCFLVFVFVVGAIAVGRCLMCDVCCSVNAVGCLALCVTCGCLLLLCACCVSGCCVLLLIVCCCCFLFGISCSLCARCSS